MAKRKIRTKAQRQKRLAEIMTEIKEANKNPAFRKAVHEFVLYHTGKINRLSNSSNE